MATSVPSRCAPRNPSGPFHKGPGNRLRASVAAAQSAAILRRPGKGFPDETRIRERFCFPSRRHSANLDAEGGARMAVFSWIVRVLAVLGIGAIWWLTAAGLSDAT